MCKSVKDFDTKHSNDAKNADKVKSKCKEIMFWLYLVSQNNDKIDAVQVTGCIDFVVVLTHEI